MVSEEKLIQQGIKYNDRLFEEIKRQLSVGIRYSETIEEFLERVQEWTSDKQGILVNGYDESIIPLILASTNNAKWSRASQRRLWEITIRDTVGDLITGVNENIRQEVKDILLDRENKTRQQLAKEMSERIDVINNKRGRAIVRTEMKRADTTANYITAKERGAKRYSVYCRSDRCPICQEAFCKDQSPDSKSNGNDVYYDIDDTSVLPPLHPNCRCSVKYHYQDITENEKPKDAVLVDNTGNVVEDTQTAKELPLEELNKMSFQELADHYGLEYRGASKDLIRKEVEHTFIEKFEDGRRMAIHFDDKAIELFTKKGIATPNEIIAEVMKVPLSLRNETGNINFRYNDEGLFTVNESGEVVTKDFDSNTLGYNITRIEANGYYHQIAINPRLFKGSKGPGAKKWIPDDEGILRWKKNIHHEFEHSGDQDQALFDSDDYMPNCWSDEYDEIHQKEHYFTEYANSDRSESWAEHGGYISYMEANPSEQHRLITIMVYDEQKGFVEKKINYSQYKKEYPLHYKYFMKRHKG